MALTNGKLALVSGTPNLVTKKQDMISSSYGESDLANSYRYPAGTDLQSIIDDVSGPSVVRLSVGDYDGVLDVTRAIEFVGDSRGESKILTTGNSKTTITVSANLIISNLTVQCDSTEADAKTIVHDDTFSIRATNCLFTGHRHEPATGTGSTGLYVNCEFYISKVTTYEVLCWSGGVEFRYCNFTGYRGIEYRDSTFNNCIFGDMTDCDLACHGATGEYLTADGSPTGFSGVSVFNNCQMYSNNNTFTMGYELNTTLNNCYIKGVNNAVYVRQGCGFNAYNCEFISTTSKALLFTGLVSPNWTAANVRALSESHCWARSCVIEPASNNYAVQVPNDSALGYLRLTGCPLLDTRGVFGFDSSTSLEDRNGGRNFIHFDQLDLETSYDLSAINNAEVVPFTTSSNVCHLDITGDNGSGVDASVTITLGRTAADGSYFPDNMMMIINNNTAGEVLTIKKGTTNGCTTIPIVDANFTQATSKISMWIFKKNSVWQQIR